MFSRPSSAFSKAPVIKTAAPRSFRGIVNRIFGRAKGSSSGDMKLLEHEMFDSPSLKTGQKKGRLLSPKKGKPALPKLAMSPARRAARDELLMEESDSETGMGKGGQSEQ